MLLECFHPSAKLTEPPYFCTYHGTDGLTLYNGFAENEKDLAKRMGEMRNMYSRFRPYRRELETGGRRVVKRPGDVPGSRTFPGSTRDGFEGDTVKQILNLEAHELFTQLVAQTNLVKIGPRNGLFTCFVPVEEGVIRVWREWLRDAAKANITNTQEDKTVDAAGKEEAKATGVESQSGFEGIDEERILWVGPNKDTGFRFNIRERKIRRDIPILVRADEEDMPVSYEIEYDGRFPIYLTMMTS